MTVLFFVFKNPGASPQAAICLSESEYLINWHRTHVRILGLLPLLRLGPAPYPCVSHCLRRAATAVDVFST